MPKYYACNANIPGGEPIEPINRKRVEHGRYWVPDCPDYDSKFGMPNKIKRREAYAGWSCWNCVHLMESSEPFTERKHESYSAQRGSAPPKPKPAAESPTPKPATESPAPKPA